MPCRGLPQHKNGVPGKHHDPLGWPQVFSCLSSLSLPFSLNYFPSFNCHPPHLLPRPFTAWPCTLPPALSCYDHTSLLAAPEHNTSLPRGLGKDPLPHEDGSFRRFTVIATVVFEV